MWQYHKQNLWWCYFISPLKGLHEYAPICKIQMLWMNILSADTVKLECETWYCCLTLQCPHSQFFPGNSWNACEVVFYCPSRHCFCATLNNCCPSCCFSFSCLKQRILFYLFLSSLLKLRMFDLLPLVHDSETFFRNVLPIFIDSSLWSRFLFAVKYFYWKNLKSKASIIFKINDSAASFCVLLFINHFLCIAWISLGILMR